MPIARLVEYKVAVPSKYAFDLLMSIGNAGIFMPITRPGIIPTPRMPSDYGDRIRRVEDISRELGRVLSQYQIPSPEVKEEVKVSTFNDMLEYIIEEGDELLTRVRQYTSAIEGLREELSRVRGILDVVSTTGPVILRGLRHFIIDVVPINEGDFNEFRKASEGYGAEVIPIRSGERFYALVMYPEWARQGLSNVYRLFNTSPLQIPSDVDLGQLKQRYDELEGKLRNLEGEFRDFLMKVSPRAYSIIDLSNAVLNITRQYTESAIPEGRDVKDRVNQLIETLNSTEARIRELESIKAALEYMVKNNIAVGELTRLSRRVLVVRGKLNEGALGGLMYIKHDIEDTNKSIIILIEPPSNLNIKELGDEVYEISPEYLSNVKSAYELVSRELTDLRGRLSDVKREYEEFIKEFNEVSSFGIDNIDKAGEDTVTIAGYVKESLSGKFDELLTSLITKLAIDARVRRESRVVYVKEIDPEKAPTLEEYPRVVDAFKKITYMYGVPKYIEVSPVFLTFILFPIFYGWMYPDLGHGLILSIFGYFLYRSRYRGPNAFLRSIFGGKYSDWGLIFLMGGIWSMVFTFIESGTIFGIEVFPAPFRLVHVEGTSMEILTDSVYATLAVSIMVGIATLLYSFVIKAVDAYREGEHDLALGFYVPLFFFFLFMVLALSSANFVPVILISEETPLLSPLYPALNTVKGLMWVWAYGAIALLAILIYGIIYFRAKYRGVPGFSAATLAVEAAAEAALPSLTNTISFMRLSVVAIMHAVFTAMAYTYAMSWGLLTPIGIALMVIFNLVIIVGEGFVAFIQSLRLHFYETYTKFFRGTGTLFTPFLLGLRWVRLLIV
ncbi:V-type ATPase 116kDa subunit family protein [Vulcanisaeta thermophila]|uniref:V-type ATPase 116kDa subunit family protein n=1 Tax=Vulcanisaeta thermophila TaxID=867917 RepID=UPI000852F2F9|nr:V-type ATPase 116kDa subunit family protein [Vulcanisaeta thermophila]